MTIPLETLLYIIGGVNVMLGSAAMALMATWTKEESEAGPAILALIVGVVLFSGGLIVLHTANMVWDGELQRVEVVEE